MSEFDGQSMRRIKKGLSIPSGNREAAFDAKARNKGRRTESGRARPAASATKGLGTRAVAQGVVNESVGLGSLDLHAGEAVLVRLNHGPGQILGIDLDGEQLVA